MNACQKESELFMCLFLCKSKYLKHFLLDIILMDSTLPPPISLPFSTISYAFARTFPDHCQKRDILFHRHCKWMMHCCETVLFLSPLKKWEFCYPYETIFILIKKFHLFCKFQTECSKNILYNFILICCKEKKSPVSPSIASTRASISSSVMNFAKEDFTVPSSELQYKQVLLHHNLLQTQPVCQSSFVACALSFALIPRTVPPFSMHL